MHTLAVVAFLLCAGAGVTFIGTRLIERAHPPRGRFIEINGLGKHVVEIGEHAGAADRRQSCCCMAPAATSRTCILRLASASPPDRVILLDRPGLGWSERRGGEEAHPLIRRRC